MSESIAKGLIENGGAAAVAVIVMAALFLPLIGKFMDRIGAGLAASMHDVVEQLRELVAAQNNASQAIQSALLEAIRSGDAAILKEMADNHAQVIRVLSRCEYNNDHHPQREVTK